MITSFDHVAITVKDIDASIAWYKSMLGFSVNRIRDIPERGMRIAFLEAGGHAMLELFGFSDSQPTKEGPILRPEETGIKHLSFFVEDLDATYQRLRAAGITFTTATSTRAVFQDPDGIVLELRRQ
jgi:glyoxylase I family protein